MKLSKNIRIIFISIIITWIFLYLIKNENPTLGNIINNSGKYAYSNIKSICNYNYEEIFNSFISIKKIKIAKDINNIKYIKYYFLAKKSVIIVIKKNSELELKYRTILEIGTPELLCNMNEYNVYKIDLFNLYSPVAIYISSEKSKNNLLEEIIIKEIKN